MVRLEANASNSGDRGTRKRGATEDEDRAMELNCSPIRRAAEHIMLSISAGTTSTGETPGSVHVSELMVIERYSHVMHIVSNVRERCRTAVTRSM